MATSITATKRTAVSDRIEIVHGRYRIIAGTIGGVSKAVAYLGTGGSRPVEDVEGESVEAAVSLMKEVLDGHLAEMRRSRRDGIPTSVEFIEALGALPSKLRETAVDLLSGAVRSVQAPVAVEDLCRRSDLDATAALGELQKLGRKLAGLLGFEPQDQTDDKRFFPLLVLARIGETDQQGIPLLAFHEELREAIRSTLLLRPGPRLVGSR